MSVTFDALAPSLLDGVVRRAPVAPTVERIRQRIAAVDATPGLVLAIQVVASLTGLWLTRHGLTTTTPAGADIYGHVARTDFALEELFPSGRLDGWFPGLGSGYRLFAVNGPGLAVLAGLVRLVTLGAADTAQAFGILGSLSIAALPWAVAGLSRELGATRLASAFHGLLALFVSFYAGGGLAGLYGPGAAPGPFPTAALLQPAATEPTALRATPIVQEPEHLVWEVDTAAAIDFVAAVAYDPTWEVAVDGGRRVPVERSTEGLTRFTVPAGQHYVTLRFTDTHPDPLGVGLTALAFTGLIARHRLTLRPTLSPVARTHSRHPEGADG